LHCRLLGLLITFCRFAMGGLFTTEHSTKNCTSIIRKIVLRRINARLSQMCCYMLVAHVPSVRFCTSESVRPHNALVFHSYNCLVSSSFFITSFVTFLHAQKSNPKRAPTKPTAKCPCRTFQASKPNILKFALFLDVSPHKK